MSADDLLERWASADSSARGAVSARVAALFAALGVAPTGGLAVLARVLEGAGEDRLWLALATLGGRLPRHAEVVSLRRASAFDGPLAAIDEACLGDLLGGGGARNAEGALPRVRVVTDMVLLDVGDTAGSTYATGIQRVVREVAGRWADRPEVAMVAWDDALPALRPLSDDERVCALRGAAVPPERPAAEEVLVPWRSTVVVPELRAEPRRADAYQALFRHSGNRSGLVGHDCVPVTTAETIASAEMGNGFAHYLAAAAHATTIAATSAGSAAEFAGWRAMLGGAGLPGPAITVVRLGARARTVPAEVRDRVRDRCGVAGLPLVLVVGSHEPRKNHLAVLHAAELLWRRGVGMALAFIGGNAWADDEFGARFRALVAAGRPVTSLDGATDDELWAAYSLARCTLFPSLNEGFGLPLVESLAVGTPVVTSDYGAMREIVELGGGGVLVDPRDPHDVAGAVQRVVEDDLLHASLASEARRRASWTWDDYAAALWEALVGPEGGAPAVR